jgi:predicted transcriptional regulator
MRKRNIISSLVLTMVIGVGATVYAASTDSSNGAPLYQRIGLGRITAMRGYDYITNILKSKLGLSESDITSAQDSGKTLYDIAIEKGMTQEQLRYSLLEEKTKAIDNAVSNGTISKEEGDEMKENLEANMENCTGNFGQNQRMGQGRAQGMNQGRGMMGKGAGQGRVNR